MFLFPCSRGGGGGGHNFDEVLQRLKRLEESQKASVDSTLADIRLLLKAPSFSKDQALDLLLNLKMVAKETNHPRAGFFDAAFRSLREKSVSPVVQFRKYMEVILGDKDQEKVLDMMSKVGKSMRLSTPGFNRVPERGRGHSFRSVQCYHCRHFWPLSELLPGSPTGLWGSCRTSC